MVHKTEVYTRVPKTTLVFEKWSPDASAVLLAGRASLELCSAGMGRAGRHLCVWHVHI